jgi:hypothetical protein
LPLAPYEGRKERTNKNTDCYLSELLKYVDWYSGRNEIVVNIMPTHFVTGTSIIMFTYLYSCEVIAHSM